MANKLDLADAQFIGFNHGQHGFGIISLIQSMGLTKREWLKIQSDYNCSYLSESDVNEIDEHFKKSGKTK